MISCREVQDIHASGRELTRIEKFKYKVHLFICRNCQKIQSQYQLITRRVKGLPDPQLDDRDQSSIDDILNNIKKTNL